MWPRATVLLMLVTCAAFTVSVCGAEELSQIVLFDDGDLVLESVDGWDAVRLRGCDITSELGRPELPVLPLTLALPPGARVTALDVVSAESTELLGRFHPRPAQHPRILPVRGLDLPVPPRVGPDATVYGGRKPYPGSIVELASSGRLGGTNLVGVKVYPVQFLPGARHPNPFREGRLRPSCGRSPGTNRIDSFPGRGPRGPGCRRATSST
jgi:hypothetical protein